MRPFSMAFFVWLILLPKGLMAQETAFPIPDLFL